MRRSAILLVLLLTLLTLPAPAQAEVTETTGWEPRLANVEEALVAAKWPAAERRARRLVGEMIERYGGFEGSPRPLAQAYTFLALAEAGLGKEADALWHWGTAQNLDPAVRRAVDLAAYGAPGELLASRPLRELDRPPAGLGFAVVTRPDVGVRQVGSGSAGPPLPVAAGPAPLPVEVQVVVDAEGRLLAPVLTYPSRFPAWAATSLEELRGWRYEPARHRGQAVASYAVITISFPAPRSDRIR